MNKTESFPGQRSSGTGTVPRTKAFWERYSSTGKDLPGQPQFKADRFINLASPVTRYASRLTMAAFTLAILFLTSLPSFAEKVTIVYDYDDLYRVKTINYGSGYREDYQYDEAGNRTSYRVSSVAPTNLSPKIDDTSKNIILKAGSGVQITGSITSNVSTIEVSADGINWTTVYSRSVNGNLPTWTYSVPSLPYGDYTYIVRASDASGNSGLQSTTVHLRWPSKVEVKPVNGKQTLFVNGSSFTVRGVIYSPVPIGDDPELFSPYGDYFTEEYKEIYERDLPLIRQMGANTVRLLYWDPSKDHTGFLDKAYENGLYVILTFPLGPDSYPALFNDFGTVDPQTQSEVLDSFGRVVAANRYHPAILIWSIGDELNSRRMYGNSRYEKGQNKENLVITGSGLRSLLDSLAQTARNQAGGNQHPVTASFLYDDASVNFVLNNYPSTVSLDVWSFSSYGSSAFDPSSNSNLFNAYRAKNTGKPLLVLGYGVDSYNNTLYAEDQGTQADKAVYMWNRIKTYSAADPSSNVCIGGTYKAYSDEWWRGRYSTDGCKDDNPSAQSACGSPNTALPDGYSNEEWWGIMRLRENSYAPDTMEQRSVYQALRTQWVADASVNLVVGWNLISLPLEPIDNSIDQVLQHMSGYWFIVWGWENGEWYLKHRTIPSWPYPLTKMEAGKAYWVKMLVPGTLTLSGTAPSRTIELSQGYNFVGYTGTIETNASVALKDISNNISIVWGYDGTNGVNPWRRYAPTDASTNLTLAPGKGYWFIMNSPAQWMLPLSSYNTELMSVRRSGLSEDGSENPPGPGNPDPTPDPLATDITSLSDGAVLAVLAGQSVTIGGAAVDRRAVGIQKVEVSTDGGKTWNLASGTANWTYTWSAPSNGNYSIITLVTDASGNTAIDNITVTTVPCPGLPVRNSRTGATYVTLQDAYNAAASGDTIQAQAVDMSGNLTANRNISITVQGGYTCDYSSYSGNVTSLMGLIQSTQGGGTVTIGNFVLNLRPPDTTPPSFQIVSTTGTIGNTVTMSGTAVDAGSGIQKVEVSMDSGATWSQATGTTDWSYTYNGSYRGIYTVWVRVTDNANNTVVSTDTFMPTVSCSGQPVRIARTGTTYATLQEAYDAAMTGDTIQVQALNVIQSLLANRNISVTLQGGFTCDYASYSGNTTWIYGSVQTAPGGGTLTISNIVLKN